jgi:release factor glutamine methyltransferase
MVDDLESSDPTLIDAIKKRAERTPLQYLLGEVGFYRESYKVTCAVLIPRPDTEMLVDYGVRNLPSGARFTDLCTGSGCVALSILNNTEKTAAVAVDISADALAVARENAESLGLSDRIELLLADALTYRAEECFAVFSNPPYVSEASYAELDAEIYKEPRIAFLGGPDGADFYRVITPLYKDKIDACGFIAYEIGYDQGKILRQIARENGMSCEIIPDLAGRDRVAVLRRK